MRPSPLPTVIIIIHHHCLLGSSSSHAAPPPQGMPHKWYQGKTGIVWNVTKRAIGVEVNKKVGARLPACHVV